MRSARAVVPWVILAVTSAAAGAEKSWYRPPKLAIMTGYIKEPLKPYTIQDWAKGLGNRMDADRWVADFREAGADYLIFYDKWIDGFVFHDTKTTGFKTPRDFLRPIADACRRGNLRLVLYYNAISDGNPEFDQWAVRDRRGQYIVFGTEWPTRYQTLHSPFRKASVEQLREVLTGYGRIDGIWLDIFGERLDTSSPWVARAYEKMYGAPFDKAPGERLHEFHVRTLAGYLDQVQPIAKKHQADCVWTSNGAAAGVFGGGLWARSVGSRLDYGSVEGHQLDVMDRLARMAWVNPMPTEVGTLVNSSWFCPMEDTPPPVGKTAKQAIAEVAIAVCQGATAYMALTPGHSGLFGDDLKVAKAVGQWFQATEPVLRSAQPYADVGIVLGAPDADGPGLPGSNSLWRRFPAAQRGLQDEALGIGDDLAREGVFGRLLLAPPAGASWPASLAGLRVIVLPELAPLDDDRVGQLREYVRQGGRLIAFGHASMLDGKNARRKDAALADVFGVRHRGEATFAGPAGKVAVKVDSEYSPQFRGEHLIDGQPFTAWASAAAPMPHWAEITLPDEVEVARIELDSRADGPYLVTDFDVEAHDGKGWKLVQSVRGAKTTRVALPLPTPAKTRLVRVKILRELYGGQNRELADVATIRVFDKAGRDRASEEVPRVPLVDMAAELKRAFGDRPVAFLPMAVQVEPTTAEVLARLANEGRSPAILRNRFGSGEAILIAPGEAALSGNAAFWAGLRTLVIGKPTLSSTRMDRYRIILTRIDGAHVLHVIDREARNARYEPAEVSISLETDRLGGLREARLVPGNSALKTAIEDGRMTLTLRPDPVASVLLK